MFTGHLPLPFSVGLEVNALNKVSRHSRSLRWDSIVAIDISGGPQQSGRLGFNRNWMGRERCEERNRTECPCEREIVDPIQSTDTTSTPEASGTWLLDDPALVLSPPAQASSSPRNGFVSLYLRH